MREHHHTFWMGDHRQGRHFARFAGGFMGGPGRGGDGFRTGRKLASTDLQLVLLALLAEKPSHGYELIKSVEDRSGGFYAPSPGMVYPALTYLEEIGHATVEQEGTKKLYHITEAGRAHLEQNRAQADAIIAELARIGSKMEHVRKIFTGETESDDDVDPRGSGEFHMARRALKDALRSKRGSGPAEVKRIADILRRAAAEIIGS